MKFLGVEKCPKHEWVDEKCTICGLPKEMEGTEFDTLGED